MTTEERVWRRPHTARTQVPLSFTSRSLWRPERHCLPCMWSPRGIFRAHSGARRHRCHPAARVSGSIKVKHMLLLMRCRKRWRMKAPLRAKRFDKTTDSNTKCLGLTFTLIFLLLAFSSVVSPSVLSVSHGFYFVLLLSTWNIKCWPPGQGTDFSIKCQMWTQVIVNDYLTVT